MQRDYRAFLAEQAGLGIVCGFCGEEGTPAHLPVVAEHGGVLVVRNQFPYEVWESQPVLDHLMIVPSRHVLSLAELSEPEARDHQCAAREYEARGYSVYTRSQTNTGRTVTHLHTHLILT